MGNDISGGVLSVVTKTGDVTELTSATGRTEIWAEAIRLIGERPLTGYGLNSSPALMEDFSYHTHNLVLHATFSGGVVAGLLVMAALFGMRLRGFPVRSRSFERSRCMSLFLVCSRTPFWIRLPAHRPCFGWP